MMKRLLVITILLSCVQIGMSQNEFDVLRYSSIEYYGDARFNAMGGSFGSLGANMSGLSINPGGLGVYKSSDFSFSPSFLYNYAESQYNGNLNVDGKLNFHFSNVGLVGNFNGGGDWQSISLAIGYNRTSNFNSSIIVNSSTDSSSLNQYVNELNSNGGTLEDEIGEFYPFSSSLAYQTYLVNPLTSSPNQYDHVFANSNNITQTTTYQTRGGSGEMYFALGGNYSDKLYLGALVGVPTVRYVYDRNYTETSAEGDTLTDFNSFNVHDFVQTAGAGVNFKLGMIYKFTNWFRIGTAFHTPTIFSLTDEYETTMTSEKKDGTTYQETTPYGSFDYIVTTPYRFVSSASLVIGSHGVVNVDYEIVDYSTARINEDTYYSTGADFTTENRNIRENFVMAQNIRVGTEWRLDPFRLRAGYRLQGNSISNQFSADNSASIYSVGAGIKEDDYYFDVSYSIKEYSNQTIIDSYQNQMAETDLKDHYVTFTLGFRF